MANEFKIKKGLIVTGASGGTVVDIQGSQGQLFSVTDDLSGSIFAVSDISGVPIFDVNSSGLSTFDGLVSGITPVNAANFVTKAYVDGSGGGTGPFLPLAGGTMTGNIIQNGGNIDFSDGRSANFGNGDDLQIYHDGSNSYINETGTGSLVVKTGALLVRNPSDASMLDAQSGGAINLYYNGVKKFETTSTGITVTGAAIIENTSAVTNDSVNVLDLKSLSSGTITNGFGVGLGFFNENTVYSAVNEVGRIEVVETDTIAVDDKMIFYVKDNNTLAERLSITGSGATFAGDVLAPRFDIGTSSTSIIQQTNRMKFTNSIANDAGGFDFYTRKTDSTYINALQILGTGNATFTTQAFATTATSSGDASSTLTTKGYVDSLITGATIYRGTWQAGISATSTGTTFSSTTLTVSAAILDAAGNTPTLVGAVVTGAGITGTVKVASVTSSTVYELDTAISATATAYIFSPIYGAPDLSGVTQTSGYYYICSEAGSATPNGAGTEPNTWDVGDWVIWNDDIGASGEWQKIDNSSVLSGVGTGQTVALWQGPGSVTDSETLGNAPITVSGNNTTFAGTITTSDDITIDNSSPELYFKTGATHYSWMVAAQENVNQTFEITPSTVVGGTTFSTPALKIDGATSNATFAGDVTLSAAGTTGEIIRTTDNTEPYFALQRNSGSNGVGVLRLLDGGDLTFDTGATGAGQTTRLTIDGATGNATFAGSATIRKSALGGSTAMSDGTLVFGAGSTDYFSWRLDSGADLYLDKAYGGVNATVFSIDRSTTNGNITFAGDVTAQGGTFTQAGGGVKILNDGTAGNNANLFFGKYDGTDGYSIGQGVTANDGVFRVYNNGTASVPLAIADNNNATFAGLVSGITPVAAANFVTKAYVDGSGGGTGPFLPLAGGTMSGNIDFVNNKDISMTDSAGAITRVMVLNTNNTMSIGPVDAYAGGSILYGIAAGVSYQRFYTGASERMRITPSGNVGIGTTLPAALLEVDNQTYSNIKAIGNFVNGNNPVRVTYDTVVVAQTDVATLSLVETVDGSQANEQKLTFSVGDGSAVIRSTSPVANGIYINVAAANSAPGYLTTSGLNAIRVLNNGNSIFNYNVGIGTTTPQSKLQVAGGIQMADDTDTAVVGKVGTMRYRTGTEYVEVTGTELVTNGDFTTDTGWTKGVGWSISGGKASSDGSQTGNSFIYQSGGLSPSYPKWYKIVFTISNYSSGDVGPNIGGYQASLTNGDGEKELYLNITNVNSNNLLYMQATTTFVGSIDNLSIMEVTEEDASYADMCMQTGASTYEWINIVRNTY